MDFIEKRKENEMAKRIGPEAKIIALFSALPEDSKRIVFDVIKSQTATPRKVAAKKSGKKVPNLTDLEPNYRSTSPDGELVTSGTVR